MRIGLENLLSDMDVYASKMEELLRRTEEKLKEFPCIDNLLEIKGIGTVTVSGFIAEVGDMGRFEPYQLPGTETLEVSAVRDCDIAGGKERRVPPEHEYYRTQKENPLKKMQSVVACKVLRIFYTILTKGVRYDPEKLLGDIKKPQVQAT